MAENKKALTGYFPEIEPPIGSRVVAIYHDQSGADIFRRVSEEYYYEYDPDIDSFNDEKLTSDDIWDRGLQSWFLLTDTQAQNEK